MSEPEARVMVTIRPLEGDDWVALRRVRLEALQTEPGAFFRAYSEEQNTTQREWRELLKGDGRQLFGLFDESSLVGITAVLTDREDPTGTTALFAMSYIAPAYRGRGLSSMLFEARLDWVRAQPQFERIVVSHRRSNEALRRANQRCGFKKTAESPRRWPDGGVEDELKYELPVRR